ncbi:endolytic transglycosylase MltG [Microbacterium sp.]|uniref:endolytic transglycosylase MltG n=1 Tax=Microbacterium sp. TaxID=51671 RepID=UPI003A885D05
MPENPPMDSNEPAPGSRRARRAAAEAAAHATRAAETPAPDVAEAPAPRAAEAPAPGATGTRAPSRPASIDVLFAETATDPGAPASRHDRDAKKSRVAKWVALMIVLAMLGALVAGGLWVWNTYEKPLRELFGWTEPRDYEDGLATGEAVVTIVTGDTGESISTTLFEAGVTKTAGAFYEYLISTRQDPTFQPGVYALQQRMSSSAALNALEDPANKRENTVLVIEGMTTSQVVGAIAAGTGLDEEELASAAADATQFGVPAEAPSIEGYLFPATYTFAPEVTATEALQRMVDETFARLRGLGVTPEESLPVLTLAGLVQKESGPDTEDMRKIARVFLNRVADGMLLQSDATVAYGAGTTGTVWTTPEERADASNPYNTYVHEGMPVGPISNPGEDAIAAAIDPAEGDWLYFVAVDLRTGETAFSDTYEQHLAAVEQLDVWCSDSENASYCE